MSGGFFRGTTADQDTRFSNKQAKLLKTQKFAPELEHLVDISKVKMDVIKPWIANRVTEYLGGFEDEVLINFIYGLLEAKEVNGKEIQIQITGFMEKNTGKFMKELWTLLLSAQKNASGVPQQFLDAKEEETRKKKAEADRIIDEIQKRKEKDNVQEKERKLDGGLDKLSAEESNKRQSGDENGADVRNGFRRRNRSSKSPYSSDRSPSPQRGHRSRSISKSNSHSRSYSRGRSKSRSVSGSPRPRKRSVSRDGARRTPCRSVSPRRRSLRESVSPRRTRYRSQSPVRRRVRSPMRRRSPRRRSPSPARRQSPSPLRRRSPRRRGSPSPWRRRSPSPRRPIRQRRRRSTSSPRSRSPGMRKSPTPAQRRFQSPIKRRSPYRVHRRSASPDRRGSPSYRGHRYQSPVRRRLSSPARRSPVPARRRSPVPARRKSPTRSPSRSLSPASRSSASPVGRTSVSPRKMKSPRLQKSLNGSPGERTRINDRTESAMTARRQSIAMSPQRDQSDRNHSRKRVPSVSPSPEKSPSFDASPRTRTGAGGEDRSPYDHSQSRAANQMTHNRSQSPHAKMKDQIVRYDSPEASNKELENAREGDSIDHKSTDRRSGGKKKESPGMAPSRHSDSIDYKQNEDEMASVEFSAEEAQASKKASYKSADKRSSGSKARDNSRSDALISSPKKQRIPSVCSDSGSEGSDKQKPEVAKKRKHKRSRREAASDDSSSDSEIEDRKETKRRRKEEKKLRKEERRRRREEQRRKREEKRASKRKQKSKDADALSSDIEKNEKDNYPSNGECGTRKYSSDEEETESRKKRLEIELREKALESLRAKKKGVSR